MTGRQAHRDYIKRRVIEHLDALDHQGLLDVLNFSRELVVKRRPQRLRPIAPADLDRLHRAFTMQPADDVPHYLAEHPELVPMLLEGRQRMEADFGADVSAILDLTTDPCEGDEVLFVRIQTGLSKDEIRRRTGVDGLDWWQPEPRQTTAGIIFDVEHSYD